MGQGVPATFLVSVDVSVALILSTEYFTTSVHTDHTVDVAEIEGVSYPVQTH
jgi:hypothetical protein